MPVGRPTKYSKKMLEKANEYIEKCRDTWEKLENGGPIYHVNLPKSEGLALYLDINRTTLYEWANKYEAFSNILDRINKLQIERLINNGLSGAYNSNIVKLVLGKHGYKEKTDLTSDDEEIQTGVIILPQKE